MPSPGPAPGLRSPAPARWLRVACAGWLLVAATSRGQGLPGLPAAEPEAVGLSAERLGRIDALARGYVERGEMPGMLTVVLRHGRVAHLGRVGFRHVETGDPMTSDTLFRIYSMTKPITGVAVLQLAERGRIALDDPVSRYLPALGRLAPDRPMTLHHLLTHTSGLTYDDASAGGVGALYAAADLYSVPDLDAFVGKLAGLPLAAPPGARWEYGVSMDVLGRVVEVVAGEPFDAYLEKHVFRPLGMVDTGFRVPAEKASRFAALYRRTGGGGIERTESTEESDYRAERPVPFGGHGLVSTAADYARFAWMLASGGELDGVRVLSPASVDLMMRDHLGPEHGPHPLASSWLGDTARGLGFGLTGAVVRDGAANGVPGSTGAFLWGGAASTFFWVDRARGLVGLQFTQLMPSDAYPVREELRRLVYEALLSGSS